MRYPKLLSSRDCRMIRQAVQHSREANGGRLPRGEQWSLYDELSAHYGVTANTIRNVVYRLGGYGRRHVGGRPAGFGATHVRIIVASQSHHDQTRRHVRLYIGRALWQKIGSPERVMIRAGKGAKTMCVIMAVREETVLADHPTATIYRVNGARRNEMPRICPGHLIPGAEREWESGRYVATANRVTHRIRVTHEPFVSNVE